MTDKQLQTAAKEITEDSLGRNIVDSTRIDFMDKMVIVSLNRSCHTIDLRKLQIFPAFIQRHEKTHYGWFTIGYTKTVLQSKWVPKHLKGGK